LFLLGAAFAWAFAPPALARLASCSCSNVSLCNPVTAPPRQEAFLFQVNSQQWKNYDWDIVTTVVLFDSLDPDFYCFAHEKNVRVVLGAGFGVDMLRNATACQEWTESIVSRVQASFLDGVNIDFEDPVELFSLEYNKLTELVANVSRAMHAAQPHSQVTFDVAWNPHCVDGRCYNYSALAAHTDFLFTMNYDEQSQVWPPRPCVAYPNCPLPWQQPAMQAFMDLGIAPSKLVLGVPWYGYDYQCQSEPKWGLYCPIQEVPFRGCPCSDAAGGQRGYAAIMSLLALNATAPGRQWENANAAPYFHYVNSADGKLHEVWYDDPASLALRYAVAKRLSWRGVGMWNADVFDYSTDSGRKDAQAMWDAMATFFKE